MSQEQRVRLAKLRWHSRRALLENDLMLERYWERYPEGPSAEQLASFEHLLTLEDHDLWALLSGRRRAATADLQTLVDLLRQPAA